MWTVSEPEGRRSPVESERWRVETQLEIRKPKAEPEGRGSLAKPEGQHTMVKPRGCWPRWS